MRIILNYEDGTVRNISADYAVLAYLGESRRYVLEIDALTEVDLCTFYMDSADYDTLNDFLNATLGSFINVNVEKRDGRDYAVID